LVSSRTIFIAPGRLLHSRLPDCCQGRPDRVGEPISGSRTEYASVQRRVEAHFLRLVRVKERHKKEIEGLTAFSQASLTFVAFQARRSKIPEHDQRTLAKAMLLPNVES
jgi:hypothetical protein